MRPERNQLVAAEFASIRDATDTAAALSPAGWRVVDQYGPYQLVDAGGSPRSRSPLPLLTLMGGIAGGAGAFLVQWLTNDRLYPLDVGNRPHPPVPAYVPVAFESTVLLAALTAVVAWLIMLGFPRLWAPVDEIPGFERASIDRFWLVLQPPTRLARDDAAQALLSRRAATVHWIGR